MLHVKSPPHSSPVLRLGDSSKGRAAPCGLTERNQRAPTREEEGSSSAGTASPDHLPGPANVGIKLRRLGPVPNQMSSARLIETLFGARASMEGGAYSEGSQSVVAPTWEAGMRLESAEEPSVGVSTQAGMRAGGGGGGESGSGGPSGGPSELIPGLPDDITIQCLVRVSRSSHSSCRMVCKAWAAQFRSPAFHSLRGALQLAEPWVYVRARSKSVGRSGRSKWTALDVLTARWHSVQSPPSEMQTRALGAGCTVAGGCLYICAGVTSDFGLEVESPLGVLYRYDPRENKWRQLRSLREARANLAFGAVGNCLIAAAGVRHFHELRSVERYHLGRPEHATGQPSCAAAVPPGRAGATWQSLGPEVQEAEEGSWARSRSHSHNQSQMRIDSGAAEPISQIYGNADDVTAGLCPDRATLRTRVTTSDSAALLPGDSAAAHARHGAALAEDASWQAGAPLPAEISCFDSAVLGSKMYVTEGWSWPFHFSPRGFVYDGDTGAWDLMRLGMSEGWTGVSAVIGARIYTLYGHNGLRRLSTYDWELDKWHLLKGQPMPIEVEPPIVAAAVDGRIYYIGKNLSTAVATLTPAPGGGAKEEVTWSMIAPSFIGRDLLPGNCAVLAV